MQTPKYTKKVSSLIGLVITTGLFAVNGNATANNSSALEEVHPPVLQTATNSLTSIWFKPERLSNNTQQLLKAIGDVEAHGLNPESYGLRALKTDIRQFLAARAPLLELLSKPYQKPRDQLENRLAKAFSDLLTDLGQGVLDAQKTQRNLFRAAPSVDTVATLEAVASGELSVEQALENVTQSHPIYTGLVAHMRKLLNERATGTIRTRVQLIKGVEPGTDDNSIINLKKRLVETGDLAADTPIDTYFDKGLENALQLVQERHGLKMTGLINEDTVVALNASVKADIEDVAINLERWRWMPRDLGARHVLVNIPAYKLQMMNDDQKIADMAVVVGSKQHQTPVFSKDVEFVEVAPTWTVPASITNNELIPKELKSPGYLARENIDFFRYSNGRLKKVPRSQVTKADFRKKPFPYVLRQRSGKDNVLGRVKILMPNKYAIYMHDTQAKSLFNKTDRAYSHGCIRLSDPQRLASLILQLDGRDEQQTQSLLAKKKTTRVRIENETQTHLGYYTAWVDDKGRLHTRKDVYKHNKNVIEGLRNENTLLNQLDKLGPIIITEQADL